MTQGGRRNLREKQTLKNDDSLATILILKIELVKLLMLVHKNDGRDHSTWHTLNI